MFRGERTQARKNSSDIAIYSGLESIFFSLYILVKATPSFSLITLPYSSLRHNSESFVLWKTLHIYGLNMCI